MSLPEAYQELLKKRKEIVEVTLMNLIERNVPYGIDPPQPALAEYETFQQNKKANYIITTDGKLVFRQYRRISAAQIMNIKG
uniref:DNA topoisomerase VI subunit B n=1 Tax=Heterorhabditis bacteriophora TaxID=37862 RepID=A0A1I7WWG2_HETBA